MFVFRLCQTAIAISAALSTTFAASLSRRAEGDTFSLFAYGSDDSGIGGFPLLSINGVLMNTLSL